MDVRKKLKLLLMILVGLFLTANLTVWAAITLNLELPIVTESSLPDGALATVTPVGAEFTLNWGRSQRVEGVNLFQIDLASAAYSDQVFINLLLVDPLEIGNVLRNRNSFIEVAVWYEDSQGSHELENGVKVSKDEATTAMMSEVSGDVILRPTVTGVERLYVLASITVPGGGWGGFPGGWGGGGNIPPGQQDQLQTLRFHCIVR
ncbi:hypothetical protein [Paenibacillus abyssi]|uniref:Uncharacterized protein n=1 Tax=Paenibacillus abyssi TaxID=1340531 RepID=A0A917G482_9BACL|nr:hypothetical protein [Paenibacillus abyssi]GGG21575.1 hypothetical protein GCM10010916_42860 [Paenibacillus abyssi]